MSKDDQIELVLLRYQQGYYRKPYYEIEYNSMSKREGTPMTETQLAIRDIKAIFEVQTA